VERLVAWAVLGLLTAAVAVATTAAGIQGSALFAALIVGLAYALVGRGPALTLSDSAFAAAQAVLGVQLGGYLTSGTLKAVASDWWSVTAVSVGTLAVTIAAGLWLERSTELDAPTASLGMVAGGASGIVAVADELGADGRLVAVMQYIRVLVILLLMPVLVQIVFGVHASNASVHVPFMSLDGLALTVGAGIAGVAIGRATNMPAGALLGPMLLSAALTLASVTDHTQVPDAFRQVAYAAIGVQVGLRFTRASLRLARDVLPRVLVTVIVLLAACALLGVALAEVSGETQLTGYLATTPGGLYAVLGVAIAGGANTTFVLAVQALRLFVMLLAAPPLVRRLAVRPGVGSATGRST
jgi:membrane AbrB-like protein